MKKQILLTILIILIGLCRTDFVFAANPPSCSQQDTTHIYFGNGINNTLMEAKFSMNTLIYAYLVKHDIRKDYPNQKFNFFVAYNYSRGTVLDILEVINQKVDETGGLTAQEILYLMKLSKKAALGAIQALAASSGGGRIIVNDALRAVDIASDAYINSLEQDSQGASRYYQQATTDSHIQKYNSDILEGKRVIVVAHSQGNLFANAAVEAVIARNPSNPNSIGIVGVGNPAGRIIGNNDYVTADDDRVINALRLTHNVLPANIDNDPGFFDDPRDFLNHNFVISYMASELTPEYALGNPLPSRARIDGMFLSLVNSLDFPASQLGDGAIKVTLEWGAQPDVDLHVFEPDNTHVYYRNLRGTSGFLDLDDVTSFGPEHYFVSCTNLKKGIYRVGVNYFRGSAPENASVQITTADGRTQTVNKALSSAVGTAGDNTPIPVADIDVNLDANGKFIFNVNLH